MISVIWLSTMVLLLISFCKRNLADDVPNTCDNDIYCYGDILETVQGAKLHDDSKYFVDMSMKVGPSDVKDKFEKIKGSKSIKEIENFVKDCFNEPGHEFEEFEPKDWVKEPKFLKRIKDKSYRAWASKLNEIWKILGRKIKPSIQSDSSKYSILYAPNPMVVPGGRFREYYYWDSYWVIVGLLHCEMNNTVKGMLENFINLVNSIGLVPNGGRVYYQKRSQPPFLIPMMDVYLNVTGDKAFIEKNVETLEKEFKFWIEKRCVELEVNGKKVKLAQYNALSKGPRPESFREDKEYAEKYFTSDDDRTNFYAEVKSAAESGWDFSSRWFLNDWFNNPKNESLYYLKTRSVIPVDLNSILYWNAKILAKFYKLLKNEAKGKEYEDIATTWLDAVTTALWSEKRGMWFDYDKEQKKSREHYYASNFVPLWTDCYPQDKKKDIVKSVVKYINDENVRDYKGGVPTSMLRSGEQWDMPNAWPPLQHMIIMGLDKTGIKDAKNLAKEFASNWIIANYAGFSSSKSMYEKYDSISVGGYGGGGEYAVQSGFGWTNGVVLDLLCKYTSLTAKKAKSNSTIVNPAFTVVSMIIFNVIYLFTLKMQLY